MRGLWFLLGCLSVMIGVLGIFLPLLPTVPLFLLATFAFARSSPKAHNWLINHKKFGPPIRDWQQNGAIRKPAKIAATFCIMAGIAISIILSVPLWALIAQILTLTAVTVFIWTRPNA